VCGILPWSVLYCHVNTTETAFLAKENLKILLFTKENKNWTKDKIVWQYLHECSIKTSIQVGDENLIYPLCDVWFILDG